MAMQAAYYGVRYGAPYAAGAIGRYMAPGISQVSGAGLQDCACDGRIQSPKCGLAIIHGEQRRCPRPFVIDEHGSPQCPVHVFRCGPSAKEND